MKHIRKYYLEIIGILLFLAIMVIPAKAQVKRDSAGNFYSATTQNGDVLTKYKYYDRKNLLVYPVYMNSKGKYFIYKVSKKTGKTYKYHLK